jgi:hypothetical protein
VTILVPQKITTGAPIVDTEEGAHVTATAALLQIVQDALNMDPAGVLLETVTEALQVNVKDAVMIAPAGVLLVTVTEAPAEDPRVNAIAGIQRTVQLEIDLVSRKLLGRLDQVL